MKHEPLFMGIRNLFAPKLLLSYIYSLGFILIVKVLSKLIVLLYKRLFIQINSHWFFICAVGFQKIDRINIRFVDDLLLHTPYSSFINFINTANNAKYSFFVVLDLVQSTETLLAGKKVVQRIY